MQARTSGTAAGMPDSMKNEIQNFVLIFETLPFEHRNALQKCETATHILNLRLVVGY